MGAASGRCSRMEDAADIIPHTAVACAQQGIPHIVQAGLGGADTVERKAGKAADQAGGQGQRQIGVAEIRLRLPDGQLRLTAEIVVLSPGDAPSVRVRHGFDAGAVFAGGEAAAQQGHQVFQPQDGGGLPGRGPLGTGGPRGDHPCAVQPRRAGDQPVLAVLLHAPDGKTPLLRRGLCGNVVQETTACRFVSAKFDVSILQVS